MNEVETLNRRLIYQSRDGLEQFPKIVAKIDEFILKSKYYDLVSSDCVVYGSSTSEFNIGREVVGHDPYFKDITEFKIKDISATKAYRMSKSFESYEVLVELIHKTLQELSKKNYRLAFKSKEIQLDFF